jgi:hypothetical protein
MSRTLQIMAIAALGCIVAVSAQTGAAGWGRPDLPYDTQLTFVRLRWTSGTFGVPVTGRGPNFWLHEFPGAEQNFMTILRDFTLVDARSDGSLVLALEDPNLFRYPVVTMWEPGFWMLTDSDAMRLREYLLKGGFVIFNDFEGAQWNNFDAQTQRVIPGARWLRMDETHPIFDSFFHLTEIDAPNPINHHLSGLRPEYFGLFEDNDPTRRLMAIANYNTNLGEYWQAAGLGYFPLESLSQGFKLGINYMVYAMTH